MEKALNLLLIYYSHCSICTYKHWKHGKLHSSWNGTFKV